MGVGLRKQSLGSPAGFWWPEGGGDTCLHEPTTEVSLELCGLQECSGTDFPRHYGGLGGMQSLPPPTPRH